MKRCVHHAPVVLAIAAAIGAAGRGRAAEAPAARCTAAPSAVAHVRFGALPDEEIVEAYALRNTHGVELRAISYGGIITSLKVPDRRGAMADIVLGFDALDGYLTEHPFFGAIIGRYGNRIGKG